MSVASSVGATGRKVGDKKSAKVNRRIGRLYVHAHEQFSVISIRSSTNSSRLRPPRETSP